MMPIPPRYGLRLGRVAALLPCLMALTGCATQGLRTGEEHFNKSCGETVPDPANGDLTTAVVNVRECIRVEAADFQNTALGQVDNSKLLSYGYTGLAAGGAGALAFDAAKAALKGLGLAAGTAAAFGSIWSPSTTATLYLGGSEAMNCIYYSSEPVEVALKHPYTRKTIEQLMQYGNTDLAVAQRWTAANPQAPDLPTLTVAIQGWSAAVKVATTALPIATDPVGFLLNERSAVINKMLAKLNSSPASISAQQKTIQGYISSAQTAANSSMATTAALSVPGAATPGHQFDTVQRRVVPNPRASSPSTAEEFAARLKGDTGVLLAAAQGYATAAGNLATCSGNVPS